MIGAPHWSFEFGQDGQQVQGVAVVETEIVDRVAVLLGRDLDVFGTRLFPKLPPVARPRDGIRTCVSEPSASPTTPRSRHSWRPRNA